MTTSTISYYPDQQSILNTVSTLIVETDVVLDVGCGIVPMNYFRPKLHIMVEPWVEYANILKHRHGDDKSVLILKLGALEALMALPDNSVDSIFLLDVIEHLEKEVGLSVIAEIERVARRQAVIFTPLGFMPQHMEAGEPDAWGLSGGEMQEHKSGWLPEDFGREWTFHICETYHQMKFNGESLEKPYGAFFAVRDFGGKLAMKPDSLSDIRRPLPSEVALERATSEVSYLAGENTSLKSDNTLLRESTVALRNELNAIKGNAYFRMLNRIFKILP